ncbi:prealbumin-like fold domain-containing protein [Luethyella okanaganae]|uniref:DUF11 domain-containing protein n=1 Tax=Luethyella okanaganae TaxID=69372 RepID=A0ABW1VDA8_9MICO
MAASFLASVGMSYAVFVPVQSASAASCATPGGFEIDGNLPPDCNPVGIDWGTPGLASDTTTQGGTYQTSNKDGSNPVGWTSSGSTPSKADFDQVYTYAQVVGGDYFSYFAWTRTSNSGTGGYAVEVSYAGERVGPDGAPQPDRSAGGYVLYLKMHGSSAPEFLSICTYTSVANYPGTCVNLPTVDFAFSSDGLFFEFGLNVTQLTGAAPSCPPVANQASVYVRSITGNNVDASGNLKAYVAPLAVNPPSTCGALTVAKQSLGGQPDSSGTAFGYAVGGSKAVGISGSLAIGGTDTWPQVPASGDFTLQETIPVGAPWSRESIVCTVPGQSPFVLSSPTDQFPVVAGETTACVITNATSGVTVSKVAQGQAADFDFTLSGGETATLASGQKSGVADYVPGSTVTITELPEPGTPAWHLTGVVCTNAAGGSVPAVINLTAGTATVTSVKGEVINCEFSNRQDGEITIVKNVEGANGTFAFTTTGGNGFDPFNVLTSNGTGQKTYSSLTPGDYTVTETTPLPNYDLTGLSCVEGGAVGANVSTATIPTSSIHLDPGELVTCTYTNTQRGTITVDKVTNPGGSTQPFHFTLTPTGSTGTGFDLTDAAAPFNSGLVSAGEYTLAEDATQNWELQTINCAGTVPSPTSSSTSPLVFALPPGGTVNCTVVNKAVPGEVTITKHVAGVPDGYPWSFDFSISPVPTGQLGTKTADNASPSVSWKDLQIGTQYTLNEASAAGWAEGAITCTGIADESPDPGFQLTVMPGLALACDVTNTAVPGRVQVTKAVSGVADGTGWSFDLAIDPSAGVLPGATQEVSGTGNTSDTVAWTKLAIGQEYTISEDLPAGWEGGAVQCGNLVDSNADKAGFQFVATPGLDLQCSITNTAKPGSAEITKTSIGGDGSFTFVLTPLPGGDPVEQIITTSGGTGTTTFSGLLSGQHYSLAEADPGAHWIDGTLGCTVVHAAGGSPQAIDESDFTVAPGDAISCAIANTAKGTIIIVKNVRGADGAFNFTGSWLDPENFAITTSGKTGTETFQNVAPGGYVVTETPKPGYDGMVLSCLDSSTGQASSAAGLTGTINLDPGETVTCVYSNTQRGMIIVDKVTTGGPEQAFPFEFSAGGAADETFSLTNAAEPWTSGLIPPGDYSVLELSTPNWTFDSVKCTGDGVSYTGANASIALAAGETVTCVYTNSPNPGSVSLTKHVLGVPAGWNFAFDATISPAVGAQPATQAMTDENPTVEWTGLVVGETYTLNETGQDGWIEGQIACTGITDADPNTVGLQFVVIPGLQLSCDVTNTAVPGSVEVTKVVHGVPEGLSLDWSFGMTISPTPAQQNAKQAMTSSDPSVSWSQLRIGTVYTLSETVPTGWTGGTVVCGGLGDLLPETSGFQFMATPGLTLDCTVDNSVVPPTGVITKELVSSAQLSDGTWDLVYTVKVTNQSVVIPLVYDLVDEPQFGSGITIDDGTATGPVGSLADDWNPTTASFGLAGGQELAASGTDIYTVHITATVSGEAFDTLATRCSPDGTTENGGFRNTAWLTVGNGEPQPATDCGEPGRAVVEKVSQGSPQLLPSGNWRVLYTVTVTNSGDKNLYYDLSDTLGFPSGVGIVSSAATNDAGVDTSSWTGLSPNTVLADNKIIAAADGGPTVHSYTVTVIADVQDITTISDAECLASTSGHGFFNGAELLNGTVVTRDDACESIPVGRLTLSKTLELSEVNGLDLGGQTLPTVGDWNLSATLGDAVHENVASTEGNSYVIPVGDYSLLEKIRGGDANPLFLFITQFVTDGQWFCNGEATDIATVVNGEDTTCGLTNTLHPVDLVITKKNIERVGDVFDVPTDEGSSFSYLFTVENAGVVPAPDTVVTDGLPATLAYDPVKSSIPSGWTAALTGADADGFGGVLTLTKTDAPMPAAGEAGSTVEFTIWVDTARSLPREGGDPQGKILDIVNTAVVHSDGIERTPENNTSTETTPVKSIKVSVFAQCVLDAPWLYYEVTPYNTQNVDPLVIRLIWWTQAAFGGHDPSIPASDIAAILADGASKVDTIGVPAGWVDGQTISGRILWPGAAVGPDGQGTAWPGWRQLPDGTWVLDPSSAFYELRGSAITEVRINPTTDATTVYPPATPNCNATPKQPSKPLASTGFESGWLVPMAGGMILVGAIIVLLIARRRRGEIE